MEICVDNLTVNENTKNKLLENISFVAKSTQTLGIIGPSGSGKTTLLHALAGITNANLQVSGVITYTDQERVQQQLTEKIAIKNHLSLGNVPQEEMNVFDPIEKIQKQLVECVAYDQAIAHVAHQRISIDLDDGVKVNYQKFQGVEVPMGDGKKDIKSDLLFKVKM